MNYSELTSFSVYVLVNTAYVLIDIINLLSFLPGNNWGVDAVSGLSGLGYGPQEQFYGCADVAILGDGAPATIPTTTTTSASMITTTSSPPTGDRSTPSSTSQLPVISSTGDPPVTAKPKCFAVNEFAGDKSMDNWCEIHCKKDFCPETHCRC